MCDIFLKLKELSSSKSILCNESVVFFYFYFDSLTSGSTLVLDVWLWALWDLRYLLLFDIYLLKLLFMLLFNGFCDSIKFFTLFESYSLNRSLNLDSLISQELSGYMWFRWSSRLVCFWTLSVKYSSGGRGGGSSNGSMGLGGFYCPADDSLLFSNYFSLSDFIYS